MSLSYSLRLISSPWQQTYSRWWSCLSVCCKHVNRKSVREQLCVILLSEQQQPKWLLVQSDRDSEGAAITVYSSSSICRCISIWRHNQSLCSPNTWKWTLKYLFSLHLICGYLSETTYKRWKAPYLISWPDCSNVDVRFYIDIGMVGLQPFCHWFAHVFCFFFLGGYHMCDEVNGFFPTVYSEFPHLMETVLFLIQLHDK